MQLRVELLRVAQADAVDLHPLEGGQVAAIRLQRPLHLVQRRRLPGARHAADVHAPKGE